MATNVTATPESPAWEKDSTEKSVVKQRTEPQLTVSFKARQVFCPSFSAMLDGWIPAVELSLTSSQDTSPTST